MSLRSALEEIGVDIARHVTDGSIINPELVDEWNEIVHRLAERDREATSATDRDGDLRGPVEPS